MAYFKLGRPVQTQTRRGQKVGELLQIFAIPGYGGRRISLL
jgi:hypothetical protein